MNECVVFAPHAMSKAVSHQRMATSSKNIYQIVCDQNFQKSLYQMAKTIQVPKNATAISSLREAAMPQGKLTVSPLSPCKKHGELLIGHDKD